MICSVKHDNFQDHSVSFQIINSKNSNLKNEQFVTQSTPQSFKELSIIN
jgi:hypothetical protein